MKRTLVVLLTAIMVSAWAPGTTRALPQGLDVNTYKSGLNFPIDMAWVPGTNRIFFTEKTGKIRILDGNNLRDRACADLNVNSDGERGLLGIVLHPNFDRNHWLYVYYSNASPLENRVTRFTVDGRDCKNPKHVVQGISAATSGYHNGGQLEFVAGKLFVSTGEAHQPSLAQKKGNRLGKILRYNADGSVPNDNPFGNNNPVWSYGHRNPFGLTHKPGDNILIETENGPECDDEMNVIRKGRNYGWGEEDDCGPGGAGPNPKEPLWRWSNIVVPTDPWWYKGPLKRLNNSVFVGEYSSGKLHKFKLTRRGNGVRKHSITYNDPGRILDVSKGPGGDLYFLTSDSIRRIHN